MKRVVIVDYGIGNVKSMANAVGSLGYEPVLTSDHDEILAAPGLILPGVGAFAIGMQNLQDRGLVDVIRRYVATGKPFLGVCLGMQLMFDESDEFGFHEGLKLIPGRVRRMQLRPDSGMKLPHVCWREINQPSPARWNDTVIDGLGNGEQVYFVHSFVAQPINQEDILATAAYGGLDFCAAVQVNNITGTQFHPEKSGKTGLRILMNFLNKI